MKSLALIAILLLGISLVGAQQQLSDVEVVKASWTKVRIGWERDPFGGPLENFDEMRSRARNERRIAQGGGERAKREAKADEAKAAAKPADEDKALGEASSDEAPPEDATADDKPTEATDG